MLSEETVIDQITITEVGQILVRRATYLLRDGVRVPIPLYARVSYEPGMELLDGEDSRVRAIAQIVWTPEVIAAATARRDAPPIPGLPVPAADESPTP
jgi:hypothetical protein